MAGGEALAREAGGALSGATGPDSAYRPLAAAQRALGDTNAEWQVLSRFAALDKEAPDAYLRLMELAALVGIGRP